MKSVAYIPNSQPESAELGLRRTSWARTSNVAFWSCSGLPETIRWEKNVCAFLRCPVGVLLWDQVQFSSVQFLSRVQLPATLWTIARLPSITCLSQGGTSLPVHHQLPESTQTHVHWVSDAIQPSHPLSSPSPPALNLSQHQGLFKWVSSSHEVAKVLEFQLQHQSFQWTPRTFA